MLSTLDYVIIVVYLIGVAVFGILAAGRQSSTRDYFHGGKTLPWWAVCFSVVATETSTLTVIGIPAVAYGGSFTFLQLTFGYMIGRVVVSVVFLPRYINGELATAYAYLGQRFGDGLRGLASVTFLGTRLLADGVRLFATAIPLKVMAGFIGLEIGYFEIIAVIGVLTIAYTLIGGIRAVVWMDVVQMTVYIGGAFLALIVLLNLVPDGWWLTAKAVGKTKMLDFSGMQGLSVWLTSPYVFSTAVLGGAVFSMASHGTDQLIVQRLLTCRTLKDSQKALIGSGILVGFQFLLFLVVGLLLWTYYGGASIPELGLTRGDEIFPKFIIEGLPAGASGLILAGIIAAAMSTLSSSLNSLASSTMLDLYERIKGVVQDDKKSLAISRLFTLFWGVVLIGFATLFEDQSNPVVELGLAIASFTYGGLLGAFLLGLLVKRANQTDAVIAFVTTILGMVFIIFGVWYVPEVGWSVILFPADAIVEQAGYQSLAWPWFTVVGSILSLAVGSLLSTRHSKV